MTKDRIILDLSNPNVTQMICRFIKSQQGLHWFELKRCRDQRTLSQNSYLWGVVYQHVAAGLSDAWGETIDIYTAHDECRRKFLRRPIIDKKTGEVKSWVLRSTTELDTKECAEYIDKIALWAAEYLNVEIPPAEKSPAKRRKAVASDS